MNSKQYDKVIKELNKDIIKDKYFKDVLIKAVKAEKALRVFQKMLEKQERLLKNY